MTELECASEPPWAGLLDITHLIVAIDLKELGGIVFHPDLKDQVGK